MNTWINKCMNVCLGWQVQGTGEWIGWIKGKMNKWMHKCMNVCIGWQVQSAGGWTE